MSGRLAHLGEERPLVLGLLDAVGHQPFHGFGAVLVEFTEVRGQIASSHHVDNLPGRRGGSHRWQIRLLYIFSATATATDTTAILKQSTSEILYKYVPVSRMHLKHWSNCEGAKA